MEYVVSMGEMSYAFKILVVKSTRRRLKDYIKRIKYMECEVD
jgi:hypothetical protein